ncbi:MAG: hypothetical protein GF364_00385 [Candidatus Lokiarchaeota archaeon]|nr:hypothetical protein [Candidatus Lokiarchaeota archaeon]
MMKDNFKKVGFGIVGLGGRAKSLASVVTTHKEGYVAHICDLKKEVVERFKAHLSEEEKELVHTSQDYSKVLSDNAVDAVIIATPDGMHAKMAIQAFDANKHVFLEKPVGINLEENHDILHKAVDSGKIFQVGYQGRCLPFFKAIKQIIDQGNDGVLGRPLFVQANELYYGGYHYFRSWWRLRKNIGGIMYQKISHDFDYLYWLFGEPERISCFGSNIEFREGNAPKGSSAKLCRDCPPEEWCQYHVKDDDSLSRKTDHCVYNSKHDIVDNTQTLIQFQNGLVVCLGMHFFPSKAQNGRTIKISGSKADLFGKINEEVIQIDPRFDRSANQNQSFVYKIPKAKYKVVYDLIDDFIHGINTNTRVEPSVKSAYWSTIMVAAAQIAMDSKKVVELAELTSKYPFPG